MELTISFSLSLPLSLLLPLSLSPSLFSSSGPNGEMLRRHGDEIEAIMVPSGELSSSFSPSPSLSSSPSSPSSSSLRRPVPYYRALGRCDDTMNLGGIKTSSIELERVCNLTEGVHETAAIAITPAGGGPSNLVMFAVLGGGTRPSRSARMRRLRPSCRRR